jgi:hypothetical protein
MLTAVARDRKVGKPGIQVAKVAINLVILGNQRRGVQLHTVDLRLAGVADDSLGADELADLLVFVVVVESGGVDLQPVVQPAILRANLQVFEDDEDASCGAMPEP